MLFKRFPNYLAKFLLLFSNILPKGIEFFQHLQERRLNLGGVKKQEGKTILLRFIGFDKDGKDGTSIALSSDILAENYNSQNPYLVGANSKAVIFWIHGGGTKTTGHQTGLEIINTFAKYGVDVISLDFPFHGEGPRKIFKTADEFFDNWLFKFIETYVPKDKKVILMGHSMGGLVVDMVHLKTNDPNSQLAKRVDGLIALAPVADVSLGKNWSLSQKQKMESQISQDVFKNRFQDIAQSDYKIFQEMVSDNKMAISTYVFLNTLMKDHSWKNADKVKNLKNMLAIVGKGDLLTYLGHEKNFKKYMANRSNVDFHIIEGQKDSKGRLQELAGHATMLDVKRPGQKNFEYTEKIFEYFENRLGIKLESGSRNQIHENKHSEIIPNLARFLTYYSGNLAFREYAKSFEILGQIKPTKDMMDLQIKADSNRPIKKKKYKPEDMTEEAISINEKNEARAEKIKRIRNRKYIPENLSIEDRAKAENLLKSLEILTNESLKNYEKLKKTQSDFRAMHDQFRKFEIEFKNLLKNWRETPSLLPEGSELRRELEEAKVTLANAMSLNDKIAVEQQKEDFYKITEADQFSFSKELEKLSIDYNAQISKYEKSMSRLTELFYKDVLSGRLNKFKLDLSVKGQSGKIVEHPKDFVQEFFGSNSSVILDMLSSKGKIIQKWKESSLKELQDFVQTHKTTEDYIRHNGRLSQVIVQSLILDNLNQQRSEIHEKIDTIQTQYIKKYLSKYYEIAPQVQLKDILNKDLRSEQLSSGEVSYMKELMLSWEKIWASLPLMSVQKVLQGEEYRIHFY